MDLSKAISQIRSLLNPRGSDDSTLTDEEIAQALWLQVNEFLYQQLIDSRNDGSQRSPKAMQGSSRRSYSVPLSPTGSRNLCQGPLPDIPSDMYRDECVESIVATSPSGIVLPLRRLGPKDLHWASRSSFGPPFFIREGSSVTVGNIDASIKSVSVTIQGAIPWSEWVEDGAIQAPAAIISMSIEATVALMSASDGAGDVVNDGVDPRTDA